ncbi:hypothetical protein A3K80_06620 [Candidatus Bathyarchaeota archaeon RBG_13_38_9]|nr:MAG: hypothetical protein A3K80_06620 [Candidatus Bathyarchaeota archaeon RBG_13_38_9]
MLEELTLLIRLQEIDNQLMDINAEKGDLPEQINKLNHDIEELQESIAKAIHELSEIDQKRHKQQQLFEEAQSRQKKSQSNIYSVKTTREYDAISSEIEQSKAQINEGERILTELDQQAQDLHITLENEQKQLAELQKEFTERESEIKERFQDSEDNELNLNHEREKIVIRLKKPIYAHYERIRKIRDGVGVSYLSDSACSYCFSLIPPQRQTEIHRMDDLILCEVCGCIIISDRLGK